MWAGTNSQRGRTFAPSLRIVSSEPRTSLEPRPWADKVSGTSLWTVTVEDRHRTAAGDPVTGPGYTLTVRA